MNRPTPHDVRKPPWLTASAVVVLASGLVAVGDSSASGVSQATVLRGNITATASAAGTVQSADTRELVFGTSGTVTKVRVAPGDKVRAGTVLARLDDSAAKDRVAVAAAILAAADDTYDNARQGICTGGAPGGSGGSRGAGGAGGAGESGGSGGGGGAKTQHAGHTSGPARNRRPTVRPTPTRTPSRTPTPTPTRTTPTPTPTPSKPTPTPTRTSPRPTPTTPRPTRSPTGRPKPTGGPGQGGGRTGGTPRGGAAGGARGSGGQGGGCQANAVELASANVTAAEVQERDAERTLAATTLTAPIDGTILSVGGQTGDRVTGQSRTPFITLGDLDDLQIQAMFPLGEVNRLKLGQPATISLGMLAGRTYRGAVTRIDPAATTSGNRALFGVMISLDDTPPAGLRTGMSASVEVVTAQADGTLYVPAGAVHPKSGDLGTVLVRHGGETVVRTVRTGVRGDRYVAVSSGLSAGDHVVMPSGTGPDGFPAATFPGA